MTEQNNHGGLSRRDFIKVGSVLGGGALLGSQVSNIGSLLQRAEAGGLSTMEENELAKLENTLYSVCLQCNTGCGIKVRILDGVAAKIDGNPLSPWTMHPHLPMSTSMEALAPVEGALCPKGQSGLQSAYDPYRLRKVLKRVGRRGENKWLEMEFDKAVEEIVEGGLLFKHVPGEESRNVEGLRALALPKGVTIPKDMGADATKVGEQKMTLADFQAKYKAHLQYLIDPNHPDLGLKSNQFVFNWGRAKGGRGDMLKRFCASMGSVNFHGHTTVCQGSLYFTGKAMSEQFRFDEKKLAYDWAGGAKFYWQADLVNSKFVIFVGASPFEANYGPPLRATEITNGIVHRGMKMAVVDPRFSKTASKAWKWIPARPGTEGALAHGMMRWIIEHKRFDTKFLRGANKAAATANGELSWSNAAWLVKIENGQPTSFARASELGLPAEVRKVMVGGKETEYSYDSVVVMKDGNLVPLDPQDTKNPVEGELLVSTTINGVQVKSSMQLLWEEASSKSIAEWGAICDVKEQDIIILAREFTSYGKQAVADVHRGVSQHTNGFFNVGAWYALNMLVGNFDWAGGMVKANTYDSQGTKAGKPFNQNTMPNKPVSFGINNIRHSVKYEKTTLFKGYPARRPFFPLASDLYQEVYASIDDMYPYQTKILFQYMGSPVYSLPAGDTVVSALKDVAKLPLYVSSDIVVGETSVYADYIFPDLTYLERWEYHGSHPSVVARVQPIRQPVIAPLTETVTVAGVEQPLSFDSMLIAMAIKLDLPGYGKDGLGAGRDLYSMDDYYVPMAANVAFGEKADGSDALPDASPEEIALFIQSRRHLPKTVFDADRWRAMVGETHWPKMVYALNRGGRFQEFEKSYKGDQVANPYALQINLYQEKTALVKDSMTGKNLAGLPIYVEPYKDCLGNSLMGEEKDFPLVLTTFKTIQHTKSRTVSNYWSLPIDRDGGLLVAAADAEQMGLKSGDMVRVASASNPDSIWDLGPFGKKVMEAKVKVIEGMRPGVVSFPLGYGHWMYGASETEINGQMIKSDARRTAGTHLNAAMRVDPHLKNVALQDLVGGSVVFYDTRVKLIKV